MKDGYVYFYNKIVNSALPANAVAVYKVLLQYADRKTWSCFPSISTISKDTKLSDRTVRRQLNVLVKEGFVIKIARKRENKGYTSNLYFLN
ncbi:MAG: helix-turn-helix domain-containing protein [Anaerorhabdus sp.]|uniref:helix-turn-helix domain-containing protein n=1 Tax=Anaerorhabdus sp. TaxID=1872524 RepID=UPI002FC7F5AD